MEELTEIIRALLVQERPMTMMYIAARLGLDPKEVEKTLNQSDLFVKTRVLWSVIAPTDEDGSFDWTATQSFFDEWERSPEPLPPLEED